MRNHGIVERAFEDNGTSVGLASIHVDQKRCCSAQMSSSERISYKWELETMQGRERLITSTREETLASLFINQLVRAQRCGPTILPHASKQSLPFLAKYAKPRSTIVKSVPYASKQPRRNDETAVWNFHQELTIGHIDEVVNGTKRGKLAEVVSPTPKIHTSTKLQTHWQALHETSLVWILFSLGKISIQ